MSIIRETDMLVIEFHNHVGDYQIKNVYSIPIFYLRPICRVKVCVFSLITWQIELKNKICICKHCSPDGPLDDMKLKYLSVWSF